MSIFLAKTENGYGFFNSIISAIPSGAVEVTNAQHSQLLLAQSYGATIGIADNVASAFDYQGKIVALDAITVESAFGPPNKVAT